MISSINASNSSVNWYYMNADSSGTNHIEQNQIDKDSISMLELAWIFNFPSFTSIQGLNGTSGGSIAPPLVVNGIVYVATNSLDVYAIDGDDGHVIWFYRPTLNTTGLPLDNLVGHVHGINYYDGKIWLSLPDCSVDGIDAVTGKLSIKIEGICANIPGNAGRYDYSGTPPVFYKDVMIYTASSVSEGTDAGRGFVSAYNISNGKLLWRWFVTPPAGGDRNWDFETCKENKCSGNVIPFYGDWGSMGYDGNHTRAGAGPAWGQPAVDLDRGILYLATSQPSPDWNATLRPGPNLYSDSIIALNITNGEMLWYYQTTPHDLYDFDCGWNVVLGEVNINNHISSAIFKACKNGYVYAINATDGKLLWYFNPPSLKRLNTENADYVQSGRYDPMRQWINYPSHGEFKQCPGMNGGVESDIAFAYGKVYVATHNLCTFGSVSSVQNFKSSNWGVRYLVPDINNANTTIYAIDASSGREVWHYFIPDIPFRGWLMVSAGMVFASTLDGNIHVIDADSGKLIHQLHIGQGLYMGPTLGETKSGRIILLQLTSSPSYGTFSEKIPGSLIAFTVSNNKSSLNQYTILISAIVIASIIAIAVYIRYSRKLHSI